MFRPDLCVTPPQRNAAPSLKLNFLNCSQHGPLPKFVEKLFFNKGV